MSQNQLFQKNSEILVLKSKMNPNEVENYLPFSNVPKDGNSMSRLVIF